MDTTNHRFFVRELREPDFYGGYINLLKDGFQIDPDTISIDDFRYFRCNQKTKTFVVEDREKQIGDGSSNYIVASATIFVEQKLIHNMGKVGHIEDVVVSSGLRGNGLGKLIVNRCIDYANDQGCYKCILDCSEKNVAFYKKCNEGFQVKGVEMALYY
jgi:glucosamine-phosphate N-acetyltransferase